MKSKKDRTTEKKISTEKCNCIAATEIIEFFKKKNFKIHIFNCPPDKK